MSHNYDNWERLVAAVLKREQLWQIFHEQSSSPSISSGSSSFSFSFGVASLDEVLLSFSSLEWPAFNRKEDDLGSKTVEPTPSKILDQVLSPVENPPSSKTGKRALRIEVPKPQFKHHCAFSPGERSENSPKISPRMTSPTTPTTPTSRVHQRTGGQSNRPYDSKQESHPLPLPPEAISNSPPFSRPNSAEASPSVPLRCPERAETLKSPWKKGKLIGTSPLGDVYIGFNCEKGGMCAMKKFNFSLDDAKSKQRAGVLRKEIARLSSSKHPNVVQCYGSETVGDNLYMYYEYMSGGSLYMILQEYGKLEESAIRSYTQQILSGLAYLHSQSIVHGNIRGASILVHPNGRAKLTNFGIETRIAGQSRPWLLTDNPYWMAPEVIMNPNTSNLPIDIWSLGCTVLEMATAKPPNSEYDGITTMSKVANHKEVPAIPNHLSGECKDFLRRCLQWDPRQRATTAQLLKHPFVKRWSPLEKQIPVSTTSSGHPAVRNAVESEGIHCARTLHRMDSRRLAANSSRPSKFNICSSDICTPRNVSAPVSPVRPRSPQQMNGHMSPPPTSRTLTPPPRSPPPLPGGISIVPYPHRPMHSPDINSPSYWDPKIIQGVYWRSHDFHEPVSSDNTALRQQFRRHSEGLLYEQLSRADRVSQQLLKPSNG